MFLRKVKKVEIGESVQVVANYLLTVDKAIIRIGRLEHSAVGTAFERGEQP
jgi:hypothetical protein